MTRPPLNLGELCGQVPDRAETGHRHEVARLDVGHPDAGERNRGKTSHGSDLAVDSGRYRQQEVAQRSAIAGLVTAVVQHRLALAQAGHGAAQRHDAANRRVARHARKREPLFQPRETGELGTRAHRRVERLDEQLVGAKVAGTDLFLLNLHCLWRGKNDPAVAALHLQTFNHAGRSSQIPGCVRNRAAPTGENRADAGCGRARRC